MGEEDGSEAREGEEPTRVDGRSAEMLFFEASTPEGRVAGGAAASRSKAAVLDFLARRGDLGIAEEMDEDVADMKEELATLSTGVGSARRIR
jgi:hypothetical protein